MLDQIQSILFVASKPLNFRSISKATGKDVSEIKELIDILKKKFNSEDSGIHIFTDGEYVQMGTNPNNHEVIQTFVKEEATGELTKAQLETLTVIAYRGPITKPELEEIRGVNCAIILRNLLMKSLILENDDDKKMNLVYSISFNALAHLGVESVEELPDYELLRHHEDIERLELQSVE